jgi:hypothetical protein
MLFVLSQVLSVTLRPTWNAPGSLFVFCSRWLLVTSLIVSLSLFQPWAAYAESSLTGAVIPGDRVNEISVEKISQFIQAYLDVLQLLEARQGELRHVSTDETPQIQAEIEHDALQRIEAVGLTRQEYLQLLNLANSDSDFSDRIAMQLQELTHDSK